MCIFHKSVMQTSNILGSLITGHRKNIGRRYILWKFPTRKVRTFPTWSSFWRNVIGVTYVLMMSFLPEDILNASVI